MTRARGQQLVLSEQQAKQAMAKDQAKPNQVDLVGAVQESECEESEGEEENSILIPSHIFEQPDVIDSNQVNIVDKPSGPEIGEINNTEPVVYSDMVGDQSEASAPDTQSESQFLEALQKADDVERPVPDLPKDQADKEALIQEQLKDESLKAFLQWTQQGEHQYMAF